LSELFSAVLCATVVNSCGHTATHIWTVLTDVLCYFRFRRLVLGFLRVLVLDRAIYSFCVFCVFVFFGVFCLVCFVLSVPVQVIA